MTSTPSTPSTLSTLSTHVLDAERGRPATGLAVTLAGPDGAALATATTDGDGRARLDVELAPGAYALTFATGTWFAAAERRTFFPEVRVAFETEPGREHHHVPLLLSPFAFTTYRGT